MATSCRHFVAGVAVVPRGLKARCGFDFHSMTSMPTTFRHFVAGVAVVFHFFGCHVATGREHHSPEEAVNFYKLCF